MKIARIPAGLFIGIAVTLFFALALFFRAYFPYDKVFVGDWIKFTGVDAYYYMRVVDNLVQNFPHMSVFDPYLLYPGGQQIIYPNFFARLLAGIIWLVGMGTPTQNTIDVIGAFYPAVLGALTVIPVYFAGKELFNRWVGILAAGLIAVLSGEFLGRSILGSTDHHVAEVLFTTIIMMFLIVALKVGREREWSFSHIKNRDLKTSAKPIIYSLLAGIALGIYLLTWAGGLLFVFIITLYIVIQSIFDHLRRKSTDYLWLTGIILFFTAGIMFLPTTPPLEQSLYPMSIIIAFLIPIVLGIISHLMSSRQLKPAYYPLVLVGLGLVGLGALYLVSPSLVRSALERFTVFVPTGTQLTTLEMQPFLFPGGNFSWQVAWGNFTTSFILSIIALAILTCYLFSRRSKAERNLLVIWSLVILVATLGQRRFAYYFAVNVALLTGYLSVVIYHLIK
ncbi:MAG: glycosyltransferase family 39 protein, partial [Chloroflexi bacterium]|nr:glycosyltransferase family 39 protein [Chloroflexota bacterium]